MSDKSFDLFLDHCKLWRYSDDVDESGFFTNPTTQRAWDVWSSAWGASALANADFTNLAADQFVDINEMVEAQDFLSEGLKILGDRGRQYGSDERECSFPQVAQAFNAITGSELKGSDICLILALVKQVRQYVQPERFHEDSAVDGVNYTALQAQELKKERE